ncbi:peptidase U62 modulator of DNA gyrase [Methanococcus aeolicus Nankai-3]|uniref:Peptidase U62 modulator of DNA gyrase n=1 Tax=Methanococcus aeolicus (strain ATCC BAA-1280 / DSM 17508 / OCM 812 / Nankai-3) TaxID=419665 RepID=A6UUH0_META3|nr:peptidase U62 modulator of DNA gyrase [Methanococcus aeolicus Nankai-3]
MEQIKEYEFPNGDLEKLEDLIDLGTYCDIRLNYGESNHITLKDGTIEEVSSGMSSGVCVRMLYENGWGYATADTTDLKEIKELIQKAYKVAKIANNESKKKVILKETPTNTDYIKSDIKINPKDISTEEKKEYLLESHKNLIDENTTNTNGSNKIVSTSVSYSDATGYSLFMSSEGTKIESDRTKVFMYMTAVASGNNNSNNLQYASERIGGDGFEVINYDKIIKLSTNAKERALRLLTAKQCPKGEFNVVLDPDLAGVFIHEAVGHASEADLVLQNDSVFKDKIGEVVGSEIVSVIDNPNIDNSFGYYKYDSEGVKGQKTTIIENGVLKGYLHSRETAGRMDMELTGNGRAQGLNKPIVRMSNTYIKPMDWDFEELLQDTKDGIYLKGSRGGQVDTGKGLFQFNSVEAFMIEKGELTTPLRDAGLSGEILDILHNIDAITNEFKLSIGYCGKGGQSVPVGDGGGSVRTRTTIC